jgi:hypothetical protein
MPKHPSGISLSAINALGFRETVTYVLQVHRWAATETGFVEVWDDVQIIEQKDLPHDAITTSAG